MSEHTLAALQVWTNGETLCQCACGAISGQKDKSFRWTITPNGDGTARVTPSIDWPGHFHLTFDRAPLGEVDWDKYEESDAYAVGHPGL